MYIISFAFFYREEREEAQLMLREETRRSALNSAIKILMLLESKSFRFFQRKEAAEDAKAQRILIKLFAFLKGLLIFAPLRLLQLLCVKKKDKKTV